jgi:uncharacterized repeat protein (TIGR03803 family)
MGGTYTFTVQATDTIGAASTATFSVHIAPITLIPSSLVNWTVGLPGYSQTIVANGAAGAVTFSESGALPPGLTLDNNGMLAGTPTAVGSFGFTVTATDSMSTTATQGYTVTINPPVTITTTMLANVVINRAFRQSIKASGGTAPVTFSRTAGTLPIGLALSSSGLLAGTAALAGTYAFTITATDSVGASSSQSYTVIVRSAVTFLTTTLAGWTVNQPGYSQTIATSGGTGTLTLSASGTLPTGLTLISSGVLTGTPVTGGNFSFTVTATDALGVSTSQTYTLMINPALIVGLPLSTLANFNGASGANPIAGLVEDASGNVFGTTYYTIFELPHGSSTITTIATFSGTNGEDPQGGLLLDGSGNLFGTTTSGGVGFSGSGTGDGTVFELPHGGHSIITLGNFNGSNGQNPEGGLVEDAVGNLYGTTARGGLGYGTVFEVNKSSSTITTLAAFGNLIGHYPESSLLLDGSGNLFGTTPSGGTYDYGTVFEVASASRSITTLAIFTGGNGAYPHAGLIEDSSGNLVGTTWGGALGLPSGTVFELKAGSGTITTLASFSGPNGSAPQGGLVMDGSGDIFGTTLSGGMANDGTVFELQKDGPLTTLVSFNGSNGSQPYDSLLLDSNGNLFGTTYGGGAFNDGAVFQLPTRLPHGAFEQPGYLASIATSGGTGTSVFSATGMLPPGLTLSTNGLLSGTPTAVGDFSFSATATDATGASASKTFTVTIDPSIMPFTLPNWTANQPGYSQTLSGAGGTGPYSFTTSGTLPPGLTLSTAGILSGTPMVAGTYPFVVAAADSSGITGSQTYTVMINPLLAITTTTLPGGAFEQPGYSQTILSSGGTGALGFSTTSTLPPGLSLSNSGVLSGTPMAVGTFTFGVTATDAIGASATQNITVTINPSILPFTLPNWTVNQPGYGQTLSGAGGVAPYTFVASGTLPTGLTLSSGGMIFGTPTAVGSFTFTVSATDSDSAVASQNYTVTINPALTIITATLANGAFNQAYNQAILTGGGTGTIIFSTTGPVPAGLTLGSDGVLSGIPTAIGNTSFMVTANDATGASTQSTFTVSILLGLAPLTLPGATVNQPAYQQTITASGGIPPYSFLATGTVPSGLSLSSSGLLTGVPSVGGTYEWHVVCLQVIRPQSPMTMRLVFG